MFTKLAIATPSRLPISSIASIAAASPSCASSVTSGPSSSRPSASARPSPELRTLAGDPQRLARERGARRERLDAAVVGAVALTRRAVQVDHHVAELGAGADRAAVELAAEDQPAADPGADRQHDRLAAAARRPGAVLGERRQVGVVVDEHRQAEPLGHHVGEHDVLERQVDGDHRVPATLIDQRGDSEADRATSPPRRSRVSSTASTTTSSR